MSNETGRVKARFVGDDALKVVFPKNYMEENVVPAVVHVGPKDQTNLLNEECFNQNQVWWTKADAVKGFLHVKPLKIINQRDNLGMSLDQVHLVSIF